MFYLHHRLIKIAVISYALLNIPQLYGASSTFSVSEKIVEEVTLDEEWTDDWEDEETTSPWQITGFLEAAQGEFLQANIVESQHALSEFRARINLDYSHEIFDLTVKADNYYDNVLKNNVWHTREFNISLSPLQSVDLKLGRQILTWGTGDYLFLNDLFVKDWQSFFSGRADEYLKAPSNSAKLGWFTSIANIELVYTPEFTPDHYVTGERFSFYSPQTQQQIAPANQFNVTTTNQAQWSIRVSKSINNIEFSFYGYKGFWPTPLGINSNNESYFPKLNSWGISALTSISSGILNIEYANYNSIEDSNGYRQNIANGQHRLLIGYEKEIAKSLTMSMQYYIEKTKHYNAFVKHSIQQHVDEYRKLITLRLRYQTLQQTLTYNFFSFYSPSDNDGYIKPSIDYRYNDNWLFSTGANTFIGKDKFSFFGQHEDNSNAWLRARYQF